MTVSPLGGDTWIVEQHQVAAMLTSRSSQAVVMLMHWRSFVALLPTEGRGGMRRDERREG